MTRGIRGRKEQDEVFKFPSSPYALWRRESGVAPLLGDRADMPPERLLQAVWQHQRLVREELFLLDGRAVRMLHPGFLNREGGPDFRDAVIQFGDASPVSGDVEVDLQAGGWHAHGHDTNPAFARVILQVLWEGGRMVPGMPAQLALVNRLDAPLGELGFWLNAEAETTPENLSGRCSGPLRQIAPEEWCGLLQQAAEIRFQSKASQFAACARQTGWEQAFWEGLFRGLGYKHNGWPMQCLAERRGRWFLSESAPLVLQARLLGIGGLLPADVTRLPAGSANYLRRTWDHWWRERDAYADCQLPGSLWRLHGQRPANHPQRRLALAAHWLAKGDLIAKIERWCAEEVPAAGLVDSLLAVLQIDGDDFWSWHWTLRSPRLPRPQPLLGAARVTDLAVNVILPWLWARAVEGKRPKLRHGLENRFFSWPAAEDNAVLRLARQRLGVGGRPPTPWRAAEQQGLIQIVRDYCDRSNAVCGGCRFPELVRKWGELAAENPGSAKSM